MRADGGRHRIRVVLRAIRHDVAHESRHRHQMHAIAGTLFQCTGHSVDILEDVSELVRKLVAERLVAFMRCCELPRIIVVQTNNVAMGK